MSKNLSGKYGQKLLNHAKQSTTYSIKTASKRAIQKTAEAKGNFIGNKIADKITRVSKTSPNNNLKTNEEILKKLCIYRTKTQKYWWSKIKGRKLLII